MISAVPNLLSPRDIEVIVAGLVNYESIAKSAQGWLTADHLNAYYPSPLPGVIWNAILNSLNVAEIAPKTPQFLKQLVKQTSEDHYGSEVPQWFVDASHAAIDAMMSTTVDEAAKVIVRKMLDVLHKTYVVDPEMERAFELAKASGDWEELKKTQVKLMAASSSISQDNIYSDPFSAMDRIDMPISPDDDVQDESVRIVTGTVLDALHRGRGVYRGLMSLVLGPTGGGKTTLVHNMVAEMTAMGYSVGYVSTEEDLDTSDMAKNRLYAACTDRDTDEWDAARNDPRRLKVPLPPAQIERIKMLRKNTTFYSFAATPTWADLEARVIANKERTGKHHDILFIDWAGPLSVVISQATGAPPHQCLEEIACGSQALAKKTGIAVFLMHQLAADRVASLKIFGKYSEMDSQNCKKMAQYAGAVYVISPYDPQMRLRVIGVKLRGDIKNFEVVAQLDPTHSKLHFLESMSVQGSSFRDRNNSAKQEVGKKTPAVRKAE